MLERPKELYHLITFFLPNRTKEYQILIAKPISMHKSPTNLEKQAIFIQHSQQN